MKITRALALGAWCLHASIALAAIDIMPPHESSQYKALLPRLEDAQLEAKLSSSDTMWYDAKSIIPGYQDSMGDPTGFRPNTIQPYLIDGAVPGGHKFLFVDRGHFNFPFHTGGADLSDNMVKINFWTPPRQGGSLLPVAYWKLNFGHWRWLFPAGTVLGEVLLVKFPDGEMRVFEIRTRTREVSGWKNVVYRPFPTAIDLMDAIKRMRPNWSMVPALKKMVEHLLDDTTLTSRTLSTTSYKGTFDTVSGSLDVLPDFGDVKLVKDLLKESLFRNVAGTTWKSNGAQIAYAAGTKSNASIVPRNYDGGMLPVDDVSCRRCHKDAGRQIRDFKFELVLYGELWGEDEIFSWHPFEASAFVQSNGDVANFNDDNRRLRTDFVNAGLVKPYNPSTHPATLYKELPRDWVYNPVRGKDPEYKSRAISSTTSDDLSCRAKGSRAELIRVSDSVAIGDFESQMLCEESRQSANGGVACVYFTPDMPVGPDGWKETGWRPMNIRTKIGLGRRPMQNRQDCLDATKASAGGVVCTNTGLGAKAANIDTNLWCGASSELKYCLEATRAAFDRVVCSFPSDGSGSGSGWVRTRIAGSCDYQSSKMSLSDCNASIPKH